MPKPKIKFLANLDSEAHALGTKYVDITTLAFLPDNIKAHDKDAIKSLIRQFGFVEPIGLNRSTGHVTSGNGRLECLLEMLSGAENVPKGIVERIFPKNGSGGTQIALKQRPNDLDPSKYDIKWFAPIVDGLDFNTQDEVTLAIGLNKSQESGGIDVTKAIQVLKRLKETNPEAFNTTGYSNEDLEHIRALSKLSEQVKTIQEHGSLEAVDPDVSEDVDENFAEKLNERWEVEPYDVWQLGKHRLICCDSTLTPEISKASPGAPRLIFTSPPYDQQRHYEGVIGDWTAMMNGVMTTITRMMSDPCDAVFNLGLVSEDAKLKFYWNDWLAFCEERLEWPVYGLYVWDKLVGYPGEYHGRLARCHEFLFHFSKGHVSANKWIPTTGEAVHRGVSGWTARKVDGGLKGITSPDKVGQKYKIPDSVVRMFSEKKRGVHTKGHPATFPVDLPEFFIMTYTAAGDIVYDPFVGSGTTILAAENLDRICYASEVSPNYCAVILERFRQMFPDQDIVKL